jgi:hypothetical protein
MQLSFAAIISATVIELAIVYTHILMYCKMSVLRFQILMPSGQSKDSKFWNNIGTSGHDFQ